MAGLSHLISTFNLDKVMCRNVCMQRVSVLTEELESNRVWCGACHRTLLVRRVRN